MKKTLLALAALSTAGCSGLRYNTQENQFDIPSFSLDDAYTVEVNIKGNEYSLTKIDRDNDGRPDLALFESNVKGIKDRRLFEDKNLDGNLNTIYIDIFNKDREIGADGIYDIIINKAVTELKEEDPKTEKLEDLRMDFNKSVNQFWEDILEKASWD